MASKLTRKKAIKISKELWAWLAETGRLKEDWPGWEKYSEMESDCALCEYDNQGGGLCLDCPYFKKFGDCCDDDSPYASWWDASNQKEHKKYAKLFLEQLEQL